MTNKILTKERATILSNILVSDKERALKLLKLGASEATRKINEMGHDFSVEEIEEYGQMLCKAEKVGDDVLQNVAGGAGVGDMKEDIIIIPPALIAVGAGAAAAAWLRRP